MDDKQREELRIPAGLLCFFILSTRASDRRAFRDLLSYLSHILELS